MGQGLARIVASTFLVLLFISSLGFPEIVAQPSDEEIVVSKIKPAVVYVQVTAQATVSAPRSYYDLKKLTVRQKPESEGGGYYDQGLKVYSLGSGFIVTPDGYIITNAHVAAKTEEECVSIFGYWWTYFLLKDISKQESLSTTEYNALFSAYQSYVADYGKFKSMSQKSSVWFGAVIPGELTITKGYAADLRKAGERPPAGRWEVTRDVAILKIEAKNLPTVKLGNSDELKTGERVIAAGYPASSDLAAITEEASVIPSITTGIVSAIRPVPAGFSVIQHDAWTSPGSSGGPLFNSRGEVVGINTFGWEEQIGQNFALPINLAKGFLREINVEPRSGELDAHWSRGIDLYYQHRYSDAISEFRQVQDLKPGFYYAEDFIQSSREAVARGEDIRGFEVGGLFIQDIYLYGVVGVAVVAVVVVLLVLRRPTGLRLPKITRMPTAKGPGPEKRPAEVGVKYCTHCGASMKVSARFCVQCGKPTE